MKNIIIGLFVFSFSSICFAEPVKVCVGSGSEWAPYNYYPREKGKPNKKLQKGAAWDLLTTIFKRMNVKYILGFYPWSRVQLELDRFDETKICELSLEASFKEERYRKYYYSFPIYKTHLGYFYNKIKFKTPPAKTLEDLKKLSICGTRDYNYSRFQLGNKKIQEANTIQQNFDKLQRANRCDVFIGSIEPLLGGKLIGAYNVPKEIESYKFDNHKKAFHIVVSKKSSRGGDLAAQINNELLFLQNSGKANEIFKKYLSYGDGI